MSTGSGGLGGAGRVLATSVDPAAPRYLAVLLDSIATVERESSPELVVLWRGLSDNDRRGVVPPVARGLRVHWIDADTVASVAGVPLHQMRRLTPHYFRLLVPYALPNCTRALYLDGDTIVLHSLETLWKLDLAGTLLAATRDYLPCIGDAISNYGEHGLDPGAPYFNSGVMLMALARWREERVALGVISVCLQNWACLSAQGRWPQFDQYGLNVLLHDRWQPLDPEWNHGAHVQGGGARIVHFAGDGKPDGPACRSEFRGLFYDRLARTGYSA